MASTYVNDLRLNELATGDASGTWGTITNTNLELIAEAFSFGTEAITTNADTHTTTIADGATDPGRSIFLKYTGTLDSACTITIGPNTVSKLWLIENATSGSQNIIIKQGSGATVTIANGQTKAIYSDGAGSGGAMVDAFTDLAVPTLFAEGKVTIDPADGAADNDFALFVRNNEATAGRNFGLMIRAGSNASDESFTVRNLDNSSEFFTVHGDGSTTVNEAGVAAADFRVESDTLSHALFVDAGLNNVGIGYGTAHTPTLSGLAILAGSEAGGIQINRETGTPSSGEGLGSVAFKGTSSANSNAAAEASISAFAEENFSGSTAATNLRFSTKPSGTGPGSAPTERMRIDSAGEVKMTRADNGVNLTLECTDTDANAGPNLKLERNATGASDDQIGNVIFHGRDDAGVGEDYGLIAGFISDATHGSTDGRLNFKVLMNGTSRDYLILNGGGSVVVNQDAQDVDFRVEGDSEANLIFSDASTDRVGLGTNSPAARLDVVETGTATAPIRTETAGGSANTVRNQISMFSGGSNGYHISTIRSNLSNDPYGFVLTENTTERLRIDNNGNLGLNGAPISLTGNATPGLTIASNGPFIVLKDANNADSCNYIANNSGVLQFGVNADDGGSKVEVAQFLSTAAVFNETSADIDFRVESDADANFLFCDSGTGGVRIHTSGPVFSSAEVFTVQASGGAGIGIATSSSTAGCMGMTASGTDTTRFLVRFDSGSGNVGTITHNGTNTSYNTSSDERLKENIKDADDAGELIDSIQVRQFDWKVDGEHQRYGMIAQELNTVAPEACAFSSDPEEMAGVDYSRLVPMLVKEIQSLRNRIAKLEGE